MDGSSKDRIVGERRFVPASLTYALSIYPDVIIGIIRNNYQIVDVHAVSGKSYVSLLRDYLPFLTLPQEDFDLCKKIAVDTEPIPLFPTEPMSSIVGRIQSKIKMEFADRSLF